jgi:hypothetical protein
LLARAESLKSCLVEPADHGVGRSRGGLSTKIHHLCDGHGLPLVVLVGPGHAHDSPMFEVLMDQLRVPWAGRGRPRTRPQAVLGDRAYSSRATWAPCDRGASARSFPNGPPRPITADAEAAEADARSGSTLKSTRAAT